MIVNQHGDPDADRRVSARILPHTRDHFIMSIHIPMFAAI